MKNAPVKKNPRIAFFLPSLRGGGVEKNFLRLAHAFLEEGYPADLVLTRLEGDYSDALPPSLNVVELSPVTSLRARLQTARGTGGHWPALIRPVLMPLRSSRILRYLPALADYLARAQPAALIAAMPFPNLVALLARRLSAVSMRVVVTERNTLSHTIHEKRRHWRWRYLPPLMRRVYPQAECIVAVSGGVADDLAATTGLSREAIKVIYNPVVSTALAQRAKTSLKHPWFLTKAPPVVLAAGRLTRAKGFDVLIRAFARLRAHRQARLLILGDGRERKALQAQIASLGLERDVEMPGFSDNPYRYMARAALFVLSSRYEGLPTVLIEALACGCPAVSTDCPSGPREILEKGRYGPLVPVDDPLALAKAMARILEHPPDPEDLHRRAQTFSLEHSVARYRELCFCGS